MVLVAYTQMHLINSLGDVFSKPRDLDFSLKLNLNSNFVYFTGGLKLVMACQPHP